MSAAAAQLEPQGRSSAEPLPTTSPTRTPLRYVANPHTGPRLRKLLGKATDEVWVVLQRRALRVVGSNTLMVKVPEIARVTRRSLRTVEFALKRLDDAGLIRRTRSRHATRIDLLTYDVCEVEGRAYAPHLPVETICWMREKRPPGRPRLPLNRPRKPMQSAESVEPPHPDEKARILSHPLVPTNPYVPALDVPKMPTPRLLMRDTRKSERHEFLIEAYASACRLFYPQAQVKTACSWMRSRIGARVLEGAAQACMDIGIGPQAWVGVQFERARRQKRKSPPRPEVVYEPKLIEEHGGAVEDAVFKFGMLLYAKQPVHMPEYKVFVQGVYDMRSMYEQTMAELRKLPRYDEAAIRAVVSRIWPEGYAETYKRAETKLRSIQAEVDQRAARGTYVWSPVHV
jgi:hypothetical protein